MIHNKLQDILDTFQGMEIDTYEGFDDCVIGYDFDGQNVRIIYSVTKMIEKIMNDYQYDELEAIEDFEFNFRGFRVMNETSPILCQDDL
jgi:hypothetical protein